MTPAVPVDMTPRVLSSNTQQFRAADLFAKQSGSTAEIFFAPAFKITRELQYGNCHFQLSEPINVQVEFRDGLWIHQSPELSILAYAPTRQQSLHSFCMDFAAIWEHIAQEDDINLTEEAKTLKRKFHQIVAAVR